jgi:hypothetical protein
MKNTSKKDNAKPHEDGGEMKKMIPNDLNRISNTLKRATTGNILIAPRGQTKEIQKLT